MAALATAGVVATPITVSTAVHMIHNVFGAVLFLAQLSFAVLATVRLRRRWVAALAGLQLLAGVGALLSWLDVVEVMLWCQLAFQLAFAILAPLVVTILVRAEPAGISQEAAAP